MITYISIDVAQGKVDAVRPDSTPNANFALEAARNGGGVIAAINKMAEVGYELIPGTVVVSEQVSFGGAFYTIFMQRDDAWPEAQPDK